MWSAKFWKDVAERAIATFAEVLLAGLPVAGAASSVDYGHVVLLAALSAAASVLKGIVATQVGAPNTAALLTTEADTERG